jgi:hypothetical protein
MITCLRKFGLMMVYDFFRNMLLVNGVVLTAQVLLFMITDENQMRRKATMCLAVTASTTVALMALNHIFSLY